MGNKQEKPCHCYSCPSCCHRRSFQAEEQKGRIQAGPLSGEDRAERAERTRQLEFTEQRTRERGATQRENSGDLQRVPPEFSADQHKHRGNYLRLKEFPPKKIKVRCESGTHTGPGIIPAPARLENLMIHRALG